MELSYHNTNGQLGIDLLKSDAKAVSQDKWALALFKTLKGLKLSPSDVKRHYDLAHGTDVPITSIRRAISNNKKNGGKIACTGERKESPYGGKEYLYTWKS